MIDMPFAQLLEQRDALDTADYARLLPRFVRGSDATAQPLESGMLIYTGARFPINRALGLGMRGRVLEEMIDQAEAFFRRQGVPPSFEVCPLADPALAQQLGERGYRIARFMNVNVRRLDPAETLPDVSPSVRVTRVTSDEVDLWARVSAQGFHERDEPLPDDDMNVILSRLAFHRPGATCFLGWVDGDPAGGGAMIARDGLVTLFSGSTRARFRGRGVQTALLRARLAWAREQGAERAMILNLPGSDAQRNVYRMGFQTAYTRVVLARF